MENNLIAEEVFLATIEKTYHFKIKLNNKYYFFIVTTLNINNIRSTEMIKTIKRGHTYYDCGLVLKNSEKKKIRKYIEDYILKIN